MDFRTIRVPNYNQSEPLGELPDPDMGRHDSSQTNPMNEFIKETSTTRRVVRTHSIPSNVEDSSAIIEMALMAQRRAGGAATRGEEWSDIDSFALSQLHAHEHAKIDLGVNQTKRLFLHLGRRYKEQGTIAEVLRCIDIEMIDGKGISTVGVDTVKRVISKISNVSQAEILIQLLNDAQGNSEVLGQLVKLAKQNPGSVKLAAALLNLARYSEAIAELESLIVGNALEHEFQKLLEANSWMFGGEYSAREERRQYTRDENADFMMRRTVDDYLELLEIKRPITQTLFNLDTSHRSHYPSSDLSKVVGQVIGYLDIIDADRYRIQQVDGVNINKLRSKIIIGRDHDEAQVNALRMYNSHLHRIEVLTFDQLVRTAKRVRDHLAEVLSPIQPDDSSMDDVP